MEKCLILFEELQTILRNLRKQPKRKYKRSTLVYKKQSSKLLYNEIIDILTNLDESYQQQILPKLRTTLFDITSFIDARLEAIHIPSLYSVSRAITAFLYLYKVVKSKNNNKMAKVDIKLGTSLVNTYDGSPENLDAFVDSAEYFYEHVIEENSTATQSVQNKAKELAAKFLRTRLSGVAHQMVHGLNTVEEIIKTLKEQCASKVNSNSIIAKLKVLKQVNGIEKFCSEVERLFTLLKNAYIKETIPNQVAGKMALKVAIETLISGIRNSETRLILKAGKFDTLSEAIVKIMENNSPQTSENNSVMITNTRRFNNPNNTNQFNRQQFNRFNNNFQRNNNTGRNYYNNYNYNRPNNYNNSYSSNRPNNNNNSNRFHTNSSNYHPNRSNNSSSRAPNPNNRNNRLPNNQPNWSPNQLQSNNNNNYVFHTQTAIPTAITNENNFLEKDQGQFTQ